jgi:outer membrane protein
MSLILRNGFLIALTWGVILFSALTGAAQGNSAPDSLGGRATLDLIIQYALEHHPGIVQAKLDEEITNKVVKGRLTDWLPQVNFNYNLQHTVLLQKTVFDNRVIPIGAYNTSFAQLNATQTIFNRDVLLAGSTASKFNIQARQNLSKVKIDAVVNVTKAFYDLIATSQQIKVNQESIVRLKRSLKDAQSRYASGIADKTDYKRATILLNNANASLKASKEQLKYKEVNLKTIIGYPVENALAIQYDTLAMEQEAVLDTLQKLNPAAHIDYRILYTQKELQDANVKYSYWSFLPSISAFANYNLNYQNNQLSDLYQKKYPYSYLGATLSLPLFQGGKRLLKMQEQRLTRKRLDVSLTNLQSVLNTEYSRSLSAYKANLENFAAQKENVDLAAEVYNVIELQYRSGVRTYLDVTIAETELRTTKLNYFNSLYQVLASKMDVLKALGQINL